MPPGRQLPARPRQELAARPPRYLEHRPATLVELGHRTPARLSPAAPRPDRGGIPARAVAPGGGKRALTRSQKPRIVLGKRRAGAEHHGPLAGYPLAMDAAALSADQQHSILACLAQCHRLSAPPLAVEALMCLGWGENSWHSTGCNSSGHCGVFQLAYSWQRMHPYTDVSYWAAYALLHGFYGYGGIIHLARTEPRATPGYITNQCQGAYANLSQGAAYYDQYRAEAQWTIKTFGHRVGVSYLGGAGGTGGSGPGAIQGGGTPTANIIKIFHSADWAGDAINAFKLLEGGANEAAHMSGLARKRIAHITSIGLKG